MKKIMPCLMDRKRIGVAVIVERSDGKILTCQRIGCRDMVNLWQFPGGSIESNETAENAASRELYEETGIARPPRLVFLCAGAGVTGEDDDLFVTQFFVARPIVDPLDFPVVNTEPDKHSDWEWVSPADLRQFEIIPLMHQVIMAFEKFKVAEAAGK